MSIRSSFHILLSHAGQKAISGNRPYVNNTWVASFHKDKSGWQALYYILSSVTSEDFSWERIVLLLFWLSVKAWLEELLRHFKRSGIDDFYWFNILPIMTWCRTLLITWIPGHCRSNWVDWCQLKASGLDSLGRHLSLSLIQFPVPDQNCVFFFFFPHTHVAASLEKTARKSQTSRFIFLLKIKW